MKVFAQALVALLLVSVALGAASALSVSLQGASVDLSVSIGRASPAEGAMHEATAIPVNVTVKNAPTGQATYDLLVEAVNQGSGARITIAHLAGVRQLIGSRTFLFDGKSTYSSSILPAFVPSEEGTYDFVATVDPDNTVAEKDETNNAATSRGYVVTRATITPSCSAQQDLYGSIELSATAGYYSDVDAQDATVYCVGSSVTATSSLDGSTYDFDSGIGCRFSKNVRLPEGNQQVTFTVQTPGLPAKSESCSFSIARGEQPTLLTYLPSNGQQFQPGDTIPVTASLIFLGQTVREGSLTAFLEDTNGLVLGQSAMRIDALGLYQGSLTAPQTEGAFRVRVTSSYQGFDSESIQSIQVAQSTTPGGGTQAGLQVVVQSPSKPSYAGVANTPPLQAVVLDENGARASGVTLAGTVTQPNGAIVPITFTETPLYFQSQYSYPDEGTYSVTLSAQKQSLSATRTFSFTITPGNTPIGGTSTSRGINIILLSPSFSIYDDASLIPPVQLRTEDEAGSTVSGANVAMEVNYTDLDGNLNQTNGLLRETPLYYESPYRYPGPGIYRILITASKGGLSASRFFVMQANRFEEQNGTLVTSNGLVVRLVSPRLPAYQSPAFTPPLQVRVEDANGAVVTGALVRGTTLITELSGTEFGEFNFTETPLYSQAAYSYPFPGSYEFNITATSGARSGKLSFNVTIGNATLDGGTITPAAALSIQVVAPHQVTYEATNVTPPVIIVVRDQNNNMVTGASITGNITLEGNSTQLSFRETPFFYTAKYDYKSAGQYLLNVTANYKNRTATTTLAFAIGPEAAFLPEFLADIITPLPRVYVEGTAPTVRAKVLLAGQPVTDATVFAVLNSVEYPLAYAQFGEYAGSLPALEEGAYSLLVVAGLGNATATDRVDFAVSKKRLFVEIISPNTTGEILHKAGEPLPLAFNVKNERGDIEGGVQVVATLLDPTGRRSIAQAFQTATGEYSTEFFATEQGTHHYNVTAEKAGFVSGFTDSEFILILERKTFVFGWDTQTLLNVILVIAILILIAAAFRAVF